MDEFSIIKNVFAPLAPAGAPAFGLSDDAAHLGVLDIANLTLTMDTMVEGVHFPASWPARDVARKLIRVNLSDLAAKGACPRGYFLALTLPRGVPDDWLHDFAEGLRSDQKRFDIALWGGDIASGGGVKVLTLTAIGEGPDTPVLRSGASAGDDLWVSGTVGDAALALKALDEDLPLDPQFESRLRTPPSRIELGRSLAGHVNAMADVSDGLAADAGHLADASGLAVKIELEQVPVSTAAQQMLAGDEGLWTSVIAGGDDYELVFAAPPGKRKHIEAAGKDAKTPVTRIGTFDRGAGVSVCRENGEELTLSSKGYRHFN